MAQSGNSSARPIKVGVIAEQTGPLSFVGHANANVVLIEHQKIENEGWIRDPAVEIPKNQ